MPLQQFSNGMWVEFSCSYLQKNVMPCLFGCVYLCAQKANDTCCLILPASVLSWISQWWFKCHEWQSRDCHEQAQGSLHALPTLHHQSSVLLKKWIDCHLQIVRRHQTTVTLRIYRQVAVEICCFLEFSGLRRWTKLLQSRDCKSCWTQGLQRREAGGCLRLLSHY